ncbi:hypothetical protein [Ensifer sp. SL37]|uniref:hypothetical protein n=1 Tax=Ensifer sp. SL37 TaxID=2995137 RepID=UPI0022765095|nr:hypothetical protein [Ensifer sp. SL37]MCY1740988.1 hypothetical protein [Ensifer sp. SL37]
MVGTETSDGDRSPGTIDATAVRAQLDRITGSAQFDVPDRARRFLVYIVEETLVGRAQRIKAYSIATEVFGRDATFEPQMDPIVRIEAARIRKALERYYLLSGQNDPVVLTIPKGSYVPIFSLREHGQATDAESASNMPEAQRLAFSRWNRRNKAIIGLLAELLVVLSFIALAPVLKGKFPTTQAQLPATPRLLVQPFEALPVNSNSTLIARGLTSEIIGQLASFKEIETSIGSHRDNPNAKIRYVLQGEVRIGGDKLRLTVRLIDSIGDVVIWASSHDENLRVKDIVELEIRIADEIAAALADPYGAIFQTDAVRAARVQPDDWGAYACTLAFYGYSANPNPQAHSEVQKCLKSTVARFPDYSTGWALLALSYVDEFRFRFNTTALAKLSLGLAEEASRRAVELDPQNTRALQARMLALFFRGDIETAVSVGARAYALNANDSELVLEYGYRLALSGAWEQGCGLLDKVTARDVGPMAQLQKALALCAYIRGDYAGAERWARASNLPNDPIYHFIFAATLGQLGKSAEAGKELQWVEQYAPDLLSNLRQEVAIRMPRPIDQEHFLAGLRKAGFPISSQ